MGGWRGTILRVNLSNGTTRKEPLDPKLARAYIGGRGLGTKILSRREIDPTVDPLSPRNVLILATGPLTGTNAPTGGRYMVITKSPLTGAVACSNSGGYFGAEMKFCGYDTPHPGGPGQAPVYLWLNNDTVESGRPRRSGGRAPTRPRIGSGQRLTPRRRSARSARPGRSRHSRRASSTTNTARQGARAWAP